MIGKIMSEAAHSIIGMFSAKPLVMENNASISDFGSLLRSPEEQRHANPDGKQIDAFNLDDVGAEETNPAAAQGWQTINVPPFINQGFGNTIFRQNQTALSAEQDPTAVEPGDFVTPDGKLSLTFNRDMMINSDELQNIRPGNGSPIGIASTIGVADIVDGRPVNQGLLPEQTGAVTDGNKLRNHQAQKTEEFQLRSQILENAAGTEIFPSSDKGLLKLQSLQPQLRGEIGELVAPSAKPPISNGLEHSDFYPTKSDASKQASALTPPTAKGGEQQAARSGLGQFDFRSSPRDPLPTPPTGLQKPTIADGEFAEPAKSDLLPATKSLETLIEQQPMTNSSTQMAVRATIQKPASFDTSTPQIAERLAAEITDISVAGGSKKFELNPRNLGRMEITFTTRGTTEFIEIQTEHRAARDVIVQHSQMLQDILKSQGRDDLNFRVDVKENMFASTRNDGASLSQQENRDAREQQARPSQRRPIASSFDGTTENDPASDNSRYA